MTIRRRRVLKQLITRGLTEAQLVGPQPLPDVPFIDVRSVCIAPELWSLVPVDCAEKHRLVPLARDGATLQVAMAEPSNIFAFDDVQFLTGLHVEVFAADEADVRAVINARRDSLRLRMQTTCEPSFLDEADAQGTEIFAKLMNVILIDAIKKSAREIVIEPRAHELVVSFLVGSDVVEHMKPPKKIGPAIAARVNAMGRGEGWFTLQELIDVDTRFFATRFGTQVSLRLFTQTPSPLLDDAMIVVPAFADAARLEPGPADGQGRVDLHTAKGWRPTWTYHMSRHASLMAAARETANVDVTDDECANGVRLFLRKRS